MKSSKQVPQNKVGKPSSLEGVAAATKNLVELKIYPDR